MENQTLASNVSSDLHNISTNGTIPESPNVALVAFSGSLMWLAVVATILGNCLVIISIITSNKLKKQLTNRYILSLACADILVGALVMVPSAAKNSHWPGLEFMSIPFCQFWVTMDLFCCTASIYNLIGVSFDRFYAVYYPIKYASEWTNRGMIVNLMIGFAWAMGLMVALPMHMDKPGFSNWANLLQLVGCAPPVDPKSKGFILYSGIIAFVIPSIVLFGLHSAIFVKMRSFQKKRLGHAKKGLKIQQSFERSSSTKKRGSSKSRSLGEIGTQNSTASFITDTTTNTSDDLDETHSTLGADDMKEFEGQDVDNVFDKIFHKKSKNLTSAEKKVKREQKNQRRITTMMSVIIGTFVLCWLPFAVMFFMFPYNFSEDGASIYNSPHDFSESGASMWLLFNPSYIELITWLAYTNSWLNPIIYTMMNKSIREAIFKVLKCGRE